jgi:hypothetical protein
MPATDVDDWIREAPESQRDQLRRLREIIRAEAPDATETLKWGQPCYERNALFCYLQRAKTHVTLGFQKGALIPDPHSRLSGAGKQMRHMKFGLGEAIDAEACAALIKEALRLD